MRSLPVKFDLVMKIATTFNIIYKIKSHLICSKNIVKEECKHLILFLLFIITTQFLKVFCYNLYISCEYCFQ